MTCSRPISVVSITRIPPSRRSPNWPQDSCAWCENVGEELDGWIAKATTSGIAEVRRYARGLLTDKAAVQAGVTLAWSNGQVEGQIHRLKLLKRQMYGRAGFDLLRRRVLQTV